MACYLVVEVNQFCISSLLMYLIYLVKFLCFLFHLFMANNIYGVLTFQIRESKYGIPIINRVYFTNCMQESGLKLYGAHKFRNHSHRSYSQWGLQVRLLEAPILPSLNFIISKLPSLQFCHFALWSTKFIKRLNFFVLFINKSSTICQQQ